MSMKLAATIILAFLTITANAAPPTDSIYALHTNLVDQNGAKVTFDTFRGHPVLISMFYASCGFVCPTLIANVQHLENVLDRSSRDRLRVLMVSIDPDNDTPEALNKLAAKHHVDTRRWAFTRATEPDVRKIAAILGIQYRKLPDGSFNHSVLVTLLDSDGQIVAKSAQLSGADKVFIEALHAATAEPLH